MSASDGRDAVARLHPLRDRRVRGRSAQPLWLPYPAYAELPAGRNSRCRRSCTAAAAASPLVLDLKAAYLRLKQRRNWLYTYLTGRWDGALHPADGGGRFGKRSSATIDRVSRAQCGTQCCVAVNPGPPSSPTSPRRSRRHRRGDPGSAAQHRTAPRQDTANLAPFRRRARQSLLEIVIPNLMVASAPRHPFLAAVPAPYFGDGKISRPAEEAPCSSRGRQKHSQGPGEADARQGSARERMPVRCRPSMKNCSTRRCAEGDAGIGSGTGTATAADQLQGPPGRGGACRHKARASTQQGSARRRRPAMSPKARSRTRRPRSTPSWRRCSAIGSAKTRTATNSPCPPASRPPPRRSTTCCARAAANSCARTASRKSGCRIARRARKNPKAASFQDQVRLRAARATSRPRSPNSSRAPSATTARRCCSASPAPARPSPWRR